MKGNMKQGSGQKNLPGKAKKPQSPNFGMMTAPKMKKGGCMKKGGSTKNCYKKGGSVKGAGIY